VSDDAPGPNEPFSDQLEQWLRADGDKTVGELGTVFAAKSFAVTVLVLMFFPALPLPTGGVTHVFEVITVLVGAEMVAGLRTVWLPARLRDRSLGAATTERVLPFMLRRIRWLERYSRPRGEALFTRRWFLRLLGLVIIAFALAAGLAPPFSGLDTLPALGAVVVALSIILGDVVALGVGVAVGLVGIALSATVGAALVHFLRRLF
jgi:hypothetical protein